MTQVQDQNLSVIKILNGMSIAIAIALLPGAVLGEFFNYLSRFHESVTIGLDIIHFAARMLPFIIGICVALQHKLDTIQSVSVGFSSVIASGVIKSVEKGVYSLAGTGDVINAGLAAVLATWIIIKFCRSLKSISIIVVPTVVPLIVGIIGLLVLPYVSLISQSIGATINYFTTLQPILMGMLIAMTFTIIIVSPISTVGIAYSIGLTGIAAAAANIGVGVAGVVLAILSYKTNSLGTVVAHLIGTPKMQMANFMKKPVMLLPCLLISGLLGMVTGYYEFQMTAQEAGFGIIGAIGPIALMDHLGWTFTSLIIMGLYFIIIPCILGFTLQKLFLKISIIHSDDYTLEY